MGLYLDIQQVWGFEKEFTHLPISVNFLHADEISFPEFHNNSTPANAKSRGPF